MYTAGHQMNTMLHDHYEGARYGECLSSGDHTHLRAFVHELVGKRLLPHLNEALRSLNEWVRRCTCTCVNINTITIHVGRVLIATCRF